MSIRRQASGKWLCECYPYGAGGKRIRRQFATKGEALSYERRLMVHVDVTIGDDSKRLSELVDIWYEMHGKTLTTGEERKAKLKAVCERLGDPPVSEFDRNMFAVYRKRRLSGEWSANKKKPTKETTVNREQSYLHAVFAELKRLGAWDGENPLEGVRHFKVGESELSFLYEDEIDRLLSACDTSGNADLGTVVRVCLATGARWSEAEKLTRSQVLPGRITFTNTKSKKNRTVPISDTIQKLLPKRRGRLFSNCYEAFTWALKKAKIELPEGQRTHVLRHSFASHFMMNGGNILVLQQILGHSTILMTMRYAHFAPDHLEAAITLNPVDRLINSKNSGDKN
ncbi:tyrosine-type recombinase/integrase [Salmonella enterica subsp. enterica serovar 4,5,12:b:-]|nr:site-specific integrase [Salmonella enterica]ECC9415101.1 site-specific integrase [Salmonella enterica subsp. enterica]EHD0027047.1 tyrosine-type recombinase/integrase [Salmonella enterica subsp. houtenae serovar 50:g,z51:-]EHF1448641.1 tyrosine-type recombinase/integrase [Salmonella enterica subsp. enterica serovar 4,5,12:b:-]EHG1576941.1 tyrosine-type recombinase/integrase [Salmonella enterica subsp. enterica serovar 4,[5],12:b:-]